MPSRRPTQLSISLGLARYMLIATFRNRNSLVFGLMFPLIFVFVFGSMGGGSSALDVGITDTLIQSKAPLAQALDAMSKSADSPIRLKTMSQADMEESVKKGKIGAGIEAGSDGAYTVVTSTSNPMAGAQASGLLQSILEKLNLKAAESAAPGFKEPFHLDHKDLSGKQFRYIDFVLPGMIGFSLLSTATFGVAFPFLTLRKMLVLKRMLATSAKPISFVVSQCLSRSVQAVIQAAIIVLTGVMVFHFQLPFGAITFLEMMVIAFLGICSFMGFGILIANIAKDEQTAPLLLNLFNLPQFLIGGVFFPIDNLPGWAQGIGNALPLSFLNVAMRKVASDGQHLYSVLPQLGGLLLWSVIAYSLAAKTFKTEN